MLLGIVSQGTNDRDAAQPPRAHKGVKICNNGLCLLVHKRIFFFSHC